MPALRAFRNLSGMMVKNADLGLKRVNNAQPARRQKIINRGRSSQIRGKGFPKRGTRRKTGGNRRQKYGGNRQIGGSHSRNCGRGFQIRSSRSQICGDVPEIAAITAKNRATAEPDGFGKFLCKFAPLRKKTAVVIADNRRLNFYG